MGARISTYLDAVEVLLELLPVPQAVAQRARRRGMHRCRALSRTSRVEDRAATPAGSRGLRLRRLRPRQLPGSSRRDHQCGKAWSGDRAGPAPCLSQSGPGAGAGPRAPRALRSAAPSSEGGGSPQPGHSRWRQLCGAASSVLACQAGSKPRPKEVPPASNTFPLGKLLFGREGITSLLSRLDFYKGPFTVSLSPSSPLVSLYHSHQTALTKTQGESPPCPC